jgi:hypothetical protein
MNFTANLDNVSSIRAYRTVEDSLRFSSLMESVKIVLQT